MTNPGAGPADDVLDLLVIGGGVMGLFTAYHASRRSARVAVLERGRVGDPATASFGQTRTYRKDYLDARYARLADEAIRLWTEFEAATGTAVLVRCGCMNIAKTSVTPNLSSTYAQLSFDTLERLGVALESFDAEEISRRFSYLRADLAHLDPDAGVVNLPLVTGALVRALEERKCPISERVEVTGVVIEGDRLRVSTDVGDLVTRSLVITAGHGTNDVLAQLPGCDLQLPITKDRPSEAKYFVPPADVRHQFTSAAMPVIAYLDTGIYLHPIVDGLVDAVKIGYYNPPDMPRGPTGVDSIASFVTQCMPGLADAEVSDVVDVDQCDYDLVADDEFVLGAVPGFTNVFVGVGWRGTGYKFSPWVGRVLFELARQEGTVYDIGRFDPARFAS
jgi:glycine/D-amino acid oxidase-like deaminating enzyme